MAGTCLGKLKSDMSGCTAVTTSGEPASGFCFGGLCVNGPPVNCVVTAWSTWARQPGNTVSRLRSILERASNGGSACPLLIETIDCAVDEERCARAVATGF